MKKYCGGEACLIRYADDFVCAFEREGDAERFYQVLGKRLEKFGLELSAEKTRVIAFDRGQSKPAGFEFLGFEFRWGPDRQGKAPVKRRTSRTKLRGSLDRFTEWCRQKRHCPVKDWFKELKPKLQGYYNYYGVSGNYASLQQFFGEARESTEMAQPAQSAEELQLGRVPPADRTFPGAAATHPPMTSGKNGGFCKLNP